MQRAFYEASVSCYRQILDSTTNVLKAGQDYADSNGRSLDEIVQYRLHETMLPFSFQVISVWHHSYGAIKGMRDGVFSPPPSKPVHLTNNGPLDQSARGFLFVSELRPALDNHRSENTGFDNAHL